MLENDLKELGLSRNEIKIYLFLLQNGVSTPPEIARGTKIALTNSYHILLKLKADGLVYEQKIGKRKRYVSSDPEALMRGLEAKRDRMKQLLPDLRALYGNQKNKPKIRFFEGVKGVQEIFNETLEEKEKILGIASTANLFKKIPNFFEGYRKKLKDKNIFFQDILTSDSANEAGAQAQSELGVFYQYKILPESYGNIVTDILIWGNKVALLTIEEPLYGTILEDLYLAKTFRILFNIAWNTAREAENKK